MNKYKIKIDEKLIETNDYDEMIDLYGKNYKSAEKLIVGENNKIIMKKAK